MAVAFTHAVDRTRRSRGRRLATQVRAELRATGFTVCRVNQEPPDGLPGTWVYANDIRDGQITVQVIGSHQEFLRAREVLEGTWLVRYDRLGHVWTVM